MKVTCDFCGSNYPKYKFPSPIVNGPYFGLDGYAIACIDCTILVEDGEIDALINKALKKLEYQTVPADKIVPLRYELNAAYGRLSIKREPF